MLPLYLLLDEAAPAAAPAGGADFSGIFMIIALIVIFYFFMIRPQNKRQKQIREARARMQKGDKVVTNGGIYGTIKEIDDTTFLITVADGVNIRVDKSCVFAANDAAEVQNQNK